MRQRWDTYWADAIEPRLFIVGQLRRSHRGLVLALGAADLTLGLLPVAFVLTTSLLIGRVPPAVAHGLGSPQWGALVTAFLLASAAFLAQQLLTPVGAALGELLKHRVDGDFRDRLFEISLRTTGIGAIEDSVALGHLRDASDRLKAGFRTPGDAATGTLAYLVRYTQLAGYVVLLGSVASWWAAVAVFACTMSFRYAHRGGLRMWTRLWPVLGPYRFRSDYFRRLALRSPAAKEVRVFGLTGWIVEQYRTTSTQAMHKLWAARRPMFVTRFLWFAAGGSAVYAAVLAVLVRSAAQGHLTLTQLALGLQATIAAVVLGDYYHEADDKAQFGMMAARAMDDLDKTVTGYVDISTAATASAAGLPTQDIRFRTVSFRYPGSARPVLDELDLTLRAGECTAIVGLNGAGKTTLVKLLARLYEPDTGVLEVDGRDVRELDISSWRAQIGVIFQDFNRYELSAADNIAFGNIDVPRRAEALRSAAAKAGILEALDALPLGLDTMLSREYDDGAELSGGQWQRVAIARALYAVEAGARVLVLDEPTAALDVRAEAAFFDEFAELTRRVTTLLISHRFSSVRHADRIVVLEHGRVLEDGTHDALIALGGRYGALFSLQASRFREGLPDEDAEAPS